MDGVREKGKDRRRRKGEENSKGRGRGEVPIQNNFALVVYR